MTVPAMPIAVAGMACQAPGADDLTGFLQLLMAGRQQFTEVPEARMPGYDPSSTGVPSMRAALLERPDLFDAAFFRISPRMASWMDPQQRLLLETSWRALEDAAIAPDRLAGTETGVYVATTSTDFRHQLLDAGAVDRYSALGTLATFHANRISHHYDLRGPSITLDTACAGGLTSVGLAVSALRSGDIDLALAGAVNFLGHGYMHSVMMRFGALSPTGSARCFDASADGYVRGEGVFLIVLKRLEDALADGNPVHAVIRGCALSHDGRGGGLVRTDSTAQQHLIRRALAQAGADIADVGYLEAHAAGTLVGDATEVMALRRLLDQRPGGPPALGAGPHDRLWVGSVKGNIGHLEGAAGAASLLKALLVLRYGVIPPTPGFSVLNPDIDLAGVPMAIADRPQPWDRRAGRPRLAGVNSFGVGGSNAHLLLEEGPASQPGGDTAPGDPAPGDRCPVQVPLSAATHDALAALAQRLADHLAQVPAESFPMITATLRDGRARLAEQRIITADGVDTLREALRAVAKDMEHPLVTVPEDGRAGSPADRGHRPVPMTSLVPYPFQRRSYWFSPSPPPPVVPPYRGATDGGGETDPR
jgi:3-oxoacyl-[acyl-carrier-protein] synthase II